MGGIFVNCGGSFSSFVGKMKAVGAQQGYSQSVLNKFFGAADFSQKVINSDRRQGIFKTDFIDFSRKLISQNRIDRGRSNSRKYNSIFNAIERDLGVPRGILLSFWAFETDYGAFQGDINTLDALMTLSHDCRRHTLACVSVAVENSHPELGKRTQVSHLLGRDLSRTKERNRFLSLRFLTPFETGNKSLHRFMPIDVSLLT